MLHEVGVSFDLYYDAWKHKIKIYYNWLYETENHRAGWPAVVKSKYHCTLDERFEFSGG